MNQKIQIATLLCQCCIIGNFNPNLMQNIVLKRGILQFAGESCQEFVLPVHQNMVGQRYINKHIKASTIAFQCS